MSKSVIPEVNVEVSVLEGFAIVRGDALPVDNEAFPGGQKSVLVRADSGEETWGFGFTWQDATDDAYNSGVVPYIPSNDERKQA